MDEYTNESVETEIPGEGQSESIPTEVPQEDVQSEKSAPQEKWDGTPWTYQYKGQQIIPRDKNHVIALMQKGHGFNSEYDQLKQERQQFEDTKSTYDKYAQLDEMFQQNPELQQKINNVVYEHQNGGATKSEGTELDPTVMEQRQLLEKTQGLYDQLTSAQADQALEGEIAQLKQQYPNDWTTDQGEGTLERRILEHAHKGNFPSLAAAYKDYMWDSVQANAKAEALRNNKMTRQNNHKAGKTGLGVQASPPSPASVNTKNMSYNQIADAINSGQLT